MPKEKKVPNQNEEVLAAIAALDAKVTALSAAQTAGFAAQSAALNAVSAAVAQANQKIHRVEELTLQTKIEVTN